MSQDLPIITVELPFEIRMFTFNYEGHHVPTKIILLDPPSHLFISNLVDSPNMMQGAQVLNTEGGSQHAGEAKEKKRKGTHSPSKCLPSKCLKV
ncbi:hypothetical protein PAXRUDRAFT_35888 [Paxillus rubicundulus Ve08.2h10]|uniref:Uncharacterized protein n=1 Tax=Paxillus rubicundulus Ve08.2h10 TaxID=930991 RepID=A0A0D0CF89_9AGAM|nr:hypothetical protein PAXRUDRAFT_35888 [Paxillus rubicundulus Ve08.2h10]